MTNPKIILAGIFAAFIILVVNTATFAADAPQSATLDIDVSKPGVAVPPMFYGLMTEEINHSYDGGLFAELIQNRTFQDSAKEAVHWSAVGDAKIAMERNEPVNSAATGELAGGIERRARRDRE